MKYYVLCFMFLCFSSCKKKNIQSTSKGERVAIVDNEIEKIIFINYKLSKRENVVAILESKLIVEGKIKRKTLNSRLLNNEDFICEQIGSKNEVLEKIVIKNPLIKIAEYIEKGRFVKKEISLDSTSLSIRMQLNPSTKKMILKLYKDNKFTILNAIEL